ncbi:MAG: GIY-YIG nuclease family protein [Candidatus Buchananbacteria bacterium]
MKIYYVYILLCSDNHFYTGVTSNLEKRLFEHKNGTIKSCYTYKRRPVTLKFYQEFQDVSEAIQREKQVKGWTREKKQALIDGDFNKLVILSCRHSSTSSP